MRSLLNAALGVCICAAVQTFAEDLRNPVIGLPIVNFDNNQHAANENQRLQNLWDGIQTYAAMMGLLNW